MQFIALIQTNAKAQISAESWADFFSRATDSGMFKGGSAIAERTLVGEKEGIDTSDYLGGFMRFDSDDRVLVEELLRTHPVVMAGGSIELYEMPKS